MSYITDFKSSPFALYNQPPTSTNYSGTATPVYNGSTGTGLNGIPDTSYDALLGSRWQTQDGRTLTFVSNAATALATGVLVQSQAEVTAFQKLAMTVPTAYPATAGTYQVLVTNGATVLNVNQFAGGYFVVASSTGIGQTLQIASHQPAAANATFVVTLIDPIQVTLSASSKVSLIANIGSNVIISPATTATGGPVGVTLYPMPASVASTYDATYGTLTTQGTPQYGFVVSRGRVGILVDSTVTAVGYPIGVSKTTAGSVGVATLTTVPQIGVSCQTLTSANVGIIHLYL